MATTYDRLVAAGAPKIAEPLFYRITEELGGQLRVQLRRRNARFGSTYLGSEYVFRSDVEEGALEAAVVSALTKVVARYRRDEALDAEAARIRGDLSPEARA